MIDTSTGVPAHIALLLNEDFNLDDPIAVRKKLKGMAAELRDQAEISRPAFPPDIENDPRKFKVVLSGGLDLFGRDGACQAPSCRISYAIQVARSIVLMSDQVTLHDYMEEAFIDLRRRPTNLEIDRLLPDLYVLKVLAPLVEAGILRFVSPYLPVCSHHIAEFDRQVEQTVDAILEKFSGEFHVERTSEYTAIHTGPMYEPPVVFRAGNDWAAAKTDAELIRLKAVASVRSALWDARSASILSGSVFSNSPVGLSGLLTQEGNRMTPAALQAYAGHRAAELPWVQGLNVRQTLELRQEAGTALPALREYLARKLSAQSSAEHVENPQDYVAELREQAAAVRAELSVATSKSPSLRRNAIGILGFSVSALSLATGSPVSALTGLLGTLGLIHQIPNPNVTHEGVLKSKPGYVLVAAQDILAHARDR